MSKVGIQTQFDSLEALRYVQEIKPKGWMGINVVKTSWLEAMVNAHPKAARIFRHYPNRPWADNPEQQAVEAVRHISGMMGLAKAYYTDITDNNEYILGPGHASAELIARADRYAATVVAVARAELGMATCAGNFNTGHFSYETVDYFPLTLQAIQKDNEVHPERPSRICLHEYNWKFLRDDDHWHTARYLRAMPPILERYPLVRCAITEVGIDQVSREWGVPHLGWRGAFPDFAQAVDAYCGDQGLGWYNDRMLESPYLDFCLIFGCGMGSDWRGAKFDIMNDVDDTAVLDRIRLFPVVTPDPPEPPPEPPPPEGEEMDIEVLDKEYHVKDFAWAKAKYGVAFRRAVALPGQKVARLVGLYEKTGYHSLITQIVDEQNRPLANMQVTFYWEGAPFPPDPETELYAHDWYRRFVWGPTNVNGDVGPGMGTGAYHGEGEGGPHAVWLHHPTILSDICEKLGMLAGTFHDHLDQKLMIVTVGEEPVPPTPPTDGELVPLVKEIRDLLKPIKEKIVDGEPAPPVDPPAIFKGEYYNNPDLTGEPVHRRDDAAINFNWGEGTPAPGVTSNDFSVRWVGTFRFETRPYQFHMRVDDGGRLYIDGAKVIDAWKDQAPTQYTFKANLTAGLHEIRMDYYEREGGATAELWWV